MKLTSKKMMNERLSISNSSPIIARFYDYKHFTYPWHFHSEYEIIWFKESTGLQFVGNNVEKYDAGDVILLGPNLPHFMKSDDIYLSGDNDLRVKGVIIQFEKEFMYHSINHYPHFIKIKKLLENSRQGIYFPKTYSSNFIELLNRIPTETGVDQITSFLQLLKKMSEIKRAQLISTSDFTNDEISGGSRIDKIISYLNRNYTRHVELEEISSFAAMNPAAFCRFFKSQTGNTFKNYILDMRISYACKLLLIEDYPISQISTECGFDTISHFNKTFKKSTKYTPSQYKKVMLTD